MIRQYLFIYKQHKKPEVVNWLGSIQVSLLFCHLASDSPSEGILTVRPVIVISTGLLESF